MLGLLLFADMGRRTIGAAGQTPGPKSDKAWYRLCRPRYLFVIDFEATCFETDQLPPRATLVREADNEAGSEEKAGDELVPTKGEAVDGDSRPQSAKSASSLNGTTTAAGALSAEEAARVQMFRTFQILPGHRLQEIIEFPIVLIDVQSGVILERWQSYVRPTLHPTLSDFCTELTGISQKTVDAAETFDVVLERVIAWMQRCGQQYDLTPIVPSWQRPGSDAIRMEPTNGDGDDLALLAARLESAKLASRQPLRSNAKEGEPCKNNLNPSMVRMDYRRNWAVATDTRRDLSFFLAHQLRHLSLPCPDALQGAYVDTRSTFAQHTDAGRLTLEDQLRVLRLQFEGRQHCGLDDASNVARVAIELVRRGCTVRTNSFYLHDPRPRPPSPKTTKAETSSTLLHQ